MKKLFGCWLAALAFLSVLATSAHAQDGPPLRKIEAGQKVVLIDFLEPRPFQQHTGVTPFTSFGKSLDGDDALAGMIRDRLARVLQDAGYGVAWETVPEKYSKPFKRWSFVHRGWSHGTIKPEYAAWFRDLMTDHGATSVVMFFPYRHGLQQTYSYNFGLATGFGDPPRDVWLNANIGAFVLNGNDLEIMPVSPETANCGTPVDFAALGVGSVKDIRGENLIPLNERIVDLAERNARMYLWASGLYGIARPVCDGEYFYY